MDLVIPHCFGDQHLGGSSESGPWQEGLGVSSSPSGSEHLFLCSLGHPPSPTSSPSSLLNSHKPLVGVVRPLGSMA